MPLIKTIELPDGLIGVWQITETSDELYPFFNSEELNNPDFIKYSYEKRRIEWMITRLLIKKIIGSNFEISYSEEGKPILRHLKFKYISITHSRQFVAVFVHETLNVGIDIEDSLRNFNSIESRFLSDAELTFINRNPTLQCLHWCAKEAIFKLIHETGVEFKTQILINPFNAETSNFFTAQFIGEHRQSNFKLYFEYLSDHCMVWVTE